VIVHKYDETCCGECLSETLETMLFGPRKASSQITRDQGRNAYGDQPAKMTLPNGRSSIR
jgi:hypothetical protein